MAGRSRRKAAVLPHRSAVILLGGWLLLQPFITNDKTRMDAKPWKLAGPRGPAHWVAAANEPVRLWQQMGAFETAADCARARGQLRAAADGKWGDAKDDVGSVASALLSAAVTARCVPGDHLDPSTTK